MAFSPDQVAKITTDFTSARNEGSTITAAVEALAADFGCSTATIRVHLKKANLIGEGVTSENLIQSDEELGIGVDDEATAPTTDPMAALLANPEFKKIFDAAVAFKAAQTAPMAGKSDPAFLKAIERLLEIQSMQQPGYIKPLSADEIERRADGQATMFRLLARFEQEGTPPLWLLQDLWYVDDNLVEAGQKIETYRAPSESMMPLNDEALAVHNAMMQWLGTPTSSFEKQRELGYEAARKAEVPLHGGMPSSLVPAPFRIVSTEKVDVSPPRLLGTLVPENRGRAAPRSPTTTRQPLGPFSVGA